MNKYEVYYNNKNYERIDKREARRLYNEGKTIMIAPCNMGFYDNIIWTCAYEVDNSEFEDFDKMFNSYSFYNLNYAETVKRANFFKEVD